MGQLTRVLVQRCPSLLPSIRHFENRRGEGPGDEVGNCAGYSLKGVLRRASLVAFHLLGVSRGGGEHSSTPGTFCVSRSSNEK